MENLDQLGAFDLQTIRANTRRLPFTRAEIQLALDVLKQNKAKGRDVFFKKMEKDEFEFRANDGLVCIASPGQLQTDLLYAKVNAGHGLLGGQKTKFVCYAGDHNLGLFEGGTLFKNWLAALSAIDCVYDQLNA